MEDIVCRGYDQTVGLDELAFATFNDSRVLKLIGLIQLLAYQEELSLFLREEKSQHVMHQEARFVNLFAVTVAVVLDVVILYQHLQDASFCSGHFPSHNLLKFPHSVQLMLLGTASLFDPVERYSPSSRDHLQADS